MKLLFFDPLATGPLVHRRDLYRVIEVACQNMSDHKIFQIQVLQLRLKQALPGLENMIA